MAIHSLDERSAFEKFLLLSIFDSREWLTPKGDYSFGPLAKLDSQNKRDWNEKLRAM